MSRRVAITGLGIICPIGNTVEEAWDAVLQGKNGIGPITHYDTAGRKVTLAGEVKDPDFQKYIDKRELRKMDPYTQFAMTAAVQAMADAGLEEPEGDTDTWKERNRWGIIMASGIGGISTIEQEQTKGLEKGFDRVSPHFIPKSISNMAAGQIAIRFGLHGHCSCTVSACASAANAIGDAFRLIRDGYEDLMVCGGAEAAITPLSIGGFTTLKALTTESDPSRASIPFDKERRGFVMGEGAGCLILEEYEHAVSRGAHIYGELAGYGANCDAHHITAPLEDGAGAARCMADALKDAQVAPEAVDYINAHGTSTPMNDRCETAAVKQVFGAYAKQLKISSTKSMTGHLLGASAAVEAVLTVKAMEQDFLPPTINYQVPDEECDLDIVPGQGYSSPINVAISNSLGFGGHNVTLVFRKQRS
ncbi:MAG: beta-ketoacyl-ACP synthase II [Eubacterium sp.]|jgi:3-oxoacyl-[acyl-carrier-protein] synthase II